MEREKELKQQQPALDLRLTASARVCVCMGEEVITRTHPLFLPSFLSCSLFLSFSHSRLTLASLFARLRVRKPGLAFKVCTRFSLAHRDTPRAPFEGTFSLLNP